MRLTGRVDLSPRERFDLQTDKSGDCWEWLGSVSSRRYPSFMVDGRSVKVHRWIYEQEIGPIPDGLQIDHMCGNTRCVNPAHLRAVTASENTRAHWREQRGVCRNGHPMTEDNIVWRRGGKVRKCRICDRERRRRYRASLT